MYELAVENMTCGGCARHVTKAVQSVDNEAKVAVDLGTKTVRVDSGADPMQVIAAINDAGYPAFAKAD